jgi:adenylate cyclase
VSEERVQRRQERVQRRLAAILFADVVGYSRLTGQDEIGTWRRLQSVLRDVVPPHIKAHAGRIVRVKGDGILVEFASAVEAVASAVALQQAMAQRNATLADAHRIELRIGINLGDIITSGDDVHGDGVNVAARLEPLAEPGGICLSATVHEHVRGKLAYPFEDRGVRTLKNIADPVQIYALGRRKSRRCRMTPRPRSRRKTGGAGTLQWLRPDVYVPRHCGWLGRSLRPRRCK